jgi:hypothetical protein
MSRPASKRIKREPNIHEKQGYARLFFMHTPSRLSRLLTGGASCKPRLVGGDKGRNKKQTVSLPGSPALWAGCFQNAHLLRFPHPSPFNVQASTPHGFGISGALHLGIFEQPVKETFSTCG